MKVIALLGSRNPAGQTAMITSCINQAFKKDAGQTEQIFLPGITIERCRNAGKMVGGFARQKGNAFIEDNFAATVDIIRSADGIIIANPSLILGDLSESMRAFS